MATITKNHKNGYQDGQQHEIWRKPATKGPLHLNQNFEISQFSNVWFNMTLCEINLIQ